MRRLSTISLFMFVLISCQQASQSSNDTDSSATIPSAAKRINAFSPTTISRLEAAKLIADFLNHPKLGPYGVYNTLGGVFERSVFELDDTKAGSLLWFCFNSKEAEGRQWYLAASKVPGYTPAVTREAAGELWKPYDYFSYTGPTTSEGEVLKFIETHKHGGSGQSPEVSQGEVRVHTEDFVQHLLPLFDEEPSWLLKHPFGYFGEMSSDFQIRKLLSQPGVAGVRYYFGYDEKDAVGKEISNKIRVILVAVDENGNNILGSNAETDTILSQTL